MTHFSLAQRVKELRNRRGISQEVLADESGLSLRTIQRIENNETVPRGDSLTRLASALNTSPNEIIDWKIQKDTNFLVVMNLSSLGFLFFPLLGILLPLVLWISKKDKILSANELGKSILNFQITCVLIVFGYTIFYFVSLFSGYIFSSNTPFESWITIILPYFIIYFYNIYMVVINSIRIYKEKPFAYRPAIKILK